MEIEGMLMKAQEADESSFGKGPKAFYSIDMGVPVSKFVVAMLNSKVLLIAQIYQTIVATPAIRVNNAQAPHGHELFPGEWVLNSQARSQCIHGRYV